MAGSDRFGPALAAVVRALARRRGLALAGVAALTVLLALAGRGLRLDEDLLAFLPRDDAEIRESARAFRAFKALDTLRIDLGPSDDRERLLAAASAFERTLRAGSGQGLVAHVMGGVSNAEAADVAATLADLAGRSLPSLVPTEEIAAIVSRYESDDALDEKLARHRELLESFEGVGAQPIVRRDPLGLEGPFFERVKELQAIAGSARLEGGRLVSEDRRHVLFVVEPSVPASDTRGGEEVLALIADAERAASAAAPGPPLRAIAVGGHRSSIENARTIKRDSWLTSLVSLALMLVLYALVFPRRWLIPLTVLPLAFGGVFALAVCAVVLGRVSAIAVGFGGILLGLADDFIVHLYYFYELRVRDGRPEPAVSAVERIATPTIAAGASIAAAFVALAASGFPGQRDLAVFATASLFGTVAFCLLVQPLLLPATKAPRPLPRAGLPLRRFVEWVERHEKLALAFVALVTLVLGWAARGVRFDDDPHGIEARSEATKADGDELDARWGDPGKVALVVARGSTLDAALEQNDRAGRDLEQLGREGAVLSAGSIAALVPSRRTQTERRAAWRALWTEERRARFAARLHSLGARHHFSARAFEPFLARIASEGEPVDAEALRAGALGALLAPHVRQDEGGWLVVAFVRMRGKDDAALAWAPALAASTGATVTTGHGFARALVGLVRTRLAYCGALAFGVVLLVLVPALRRPRHVLAAVLPLVLGLVWSLGILALAGTTLNLVNFLIPVLTFGLSVDYVLFLASGYLRPPLEADEVEQAQGAVVASSMTTLGGMASLLLARHPALFSVGVVALAGTACSLVAIFVLTPVLLRKRTS